jgi:hypothetical protein
MPQQSSTLRSAQRLKKNRLIPFRPIRLFSTIAAANDEQTVLRWSAGAIAAWQAALEAVDDRQRFWSRSLEVDAWSTAARSSLAIG